MLKKSYEFRLEITHPANLCMICRPTSLKSINRELSFAAYNEGLFAYTQ